MKYTILSNYESYKGGVNNLQIAMVVDEKNINNTIKVFTSIKDQAEKKARAYINKLKKER